MLRQRALLLSVALLLAAAVSATEPRAETRPEPPADATFEETAEVIEVQVPVNVTDRAGVPIRGLTAADFEILDEGDSREVKSFRVVDLDLITPDDASAIPAAARRHLLFLFDLSWSMPSSIVRAREAARDFVLESLHPTDLAAVAVHTVDQGTRLVVTFTPDRAQLARAIDTLGAPQLLELALRDPLRFVIESPYADSILASGDSGGTGTVSALGQEVSAHIKVLTKQMNVSEKSFARGRISSWSRSMGELARYLDSVQGRKHVVFFSEGFDGRLLFGRRPSGDDPEQREDMNNMQFGNHWLVDTDDIYGNAPLQTEIDLMLEEFRRADCAIQAVDISGLRADSPEAERARSVGQDALFYMADDTGGRLYAEANDFGDELGRVLSSSSVTYLLSFEPEEVPRDGSYRRLKVKVAAPRGVEVSHRVGYYTPRPFEELHPLERNLLAADAIASAEPRRDLELSVLAASFPTGEEKAYVPVIIEVGGDSLLAGQDGHGMAVELYAYVTDPNGQIRDFFTQHVTLDLERRREAFARTGLKYYGHLDLPAGDYLIRVLVRNGATGRTGVETIPLAVPASVAQPVLMPPFFLEAPGKWFLVRENPGAGYQTSIVYPFTVNGEPYVPAARPALDSDEAAHFCLVGYNLGGDGLVLDGRVLDADGEEVAAAGVVELLERTVTGIRGLDKLLATFRPNGLEAGTYTLHVAVRDSAAGVVGTNSIPFTIPPRTHPPAY